MGPSHLRPLILLDQQLIIVASWQLFHIRLMVRPLSFPLHGVRTSLYRGESAVCFPSSRVGIAPTIRSSVVKLLCHASPVLSRLRVNAAHCSNCGQTPTWDRKTIYSMSLRHRLRTPRQ